MKRNGSGRSAPKPTNGKHPIQTLSAFKPQKRNVNLGKPHGLAALDKSIRRDGYSAPMVAAADGEIFAGSKRLETSADVFGPDVKPIVIHSDGTRPIVHVRDDIPDADDPRAKRLGVADNLIAAMDWNPDGELLAALIGEDKFIEEMARQENASLKALAEYQSEQELVDAEPQIDRAEELNKKWKVKTGDLWHIGEHRLLCGDCTVHENIERVMGGEKAGAVVTDPPYGIGYEYNEYNDDREKWFELMNIVIPILKNLAPFVIIPCCGIDRLGWWYLNHNPDWLMCWYKGSPGHHSHVGFNDWEAHLVWGKPPKQIHDYWQTICGFDIDGHPCPKPVAYASWLVERAAEIDAIIYEPFSGSGTTLVACQNLGRRCRAIEISPTYCAVTLERMAMAFPELPIERITA